MSPDSLYAKVSTEAMNRVVERIGEPWPDPLLTVAQGGIRARRDVTVGRQQPHLHEQ